MSTKKLLSTRGHWFIDRQGRHVLLRGVNLGGSSKIPFGWSQRDAADPDCQRPVSFVGRPFPLDQADQHFERLKSWGFNTLRFLTTWEAVEHRGPGIYDQEYLDYFTEVVRRAGEHGFYVFVDPHQDAWSRLSGGDGAPTWTLETAGFNPLALNTSEAAITQHGRSLSDYPPMVWPNNWNRLASCTLFTLFLAGDRFAPSLKVHGEGIQSYLQRHFIQAMQQIAVRLRGMDHVLGFDSMNEPSRGYLGIEDLSNPQRVYNTCAQVSGWDSMLLGAGIPRELPWIERQGVDQVLRGNRVLNPEGVSAWRSPAQDIWRNHGVWEFGQNGEPQLLQPHYFSKFDFFGEGLLPFIKNFARGLLEVDATLTLFIEGEPGSTDPMNWDLPMPLVNASHWYDVLTLITKHYDPERALRWTDYTPVLGYEQVQKNYNAEIASFVNHSRHHLSGAPTLIGEFGLNFDLDRDLNGIPAYRTGNFASQTLALSRYYDALDSQWAHSTLWNYTSDNTNVEGDHWNGEDLSIYSLDQPQGRGVQGFSRPTLIAASGTPITQKFDSATKVFELSIHAEAESGIPTEVFAGKSHYPQGLAVEVSSGQTRWSEDERNLIWSDIRPGAQTLRLRPLN
jgi:hypothetical protein